MVSSATIPGLRRQAKASAFLTGHLQMGVAGVAESDCHVLIVGENGVGKRLLAAQIHALSHRSRAAYAEIRSSDANEQVLSAALSGKGTVHLTEVDELSLDLQEWIVNNYLNADGTQSGRLLCGTSRELIDEVRNWRMREDFYYTISALTLRISPLRYRRAEILSIADVLLTQYAKQFDRPKPVLQDELVGFLKNHTWPYNLSELQTAMKTVVAIDDQNIALAALKASAATAKLNAGRRVPPLKQAARVASTQIEQRLISEVLAATGGNRKRAADELGISYKALLYKLKQAGGASQPATGRNGVRL